MRRTGIILSIGLVVVLSLLAGMKFIHAQAAQAQAKAVPGWRQVNFSGFGNPSIGSIPSLEAFQGYLYAGTFQNQPGPQHLYHSANSLDWEEISYDFDTGISSLIAFSDTLIAGTWQGSIYISPNGISWTQVMTGEVDMGIASFSQFSNTLYAGTYCNGHQGVLIWQSVDGMNWEPFDSNTDDPDACGVISAAEFEGALYFGVADWTGISGGRIWRMDGITLTEVVSGGFDTVENRAPGGLAAFEGRLYASIYNPLGDQVWRSDSGDAGTWMKVLDIGLGEPGDKARTGLIAYEDRLYLTAQNDETGMQVWSTANGTTWKRANLDGFGDSNSISSEWSNAKVVFKDQLYLEVDNWTVGAQIWQYLDYRHHLPLVARGP